MSQPTLALSSPKITGTQGDGLLTMSEILGLRLNADCVVLSACNTGLGYGSRSEAISGLGRAFFYAGAKSLLLSHWAMETESARRLTTGLFLNQKKDASLSRAQTLRQSMLDLMDGPGIVDEKTGKTIASYAHPLFWAPFVIVGE